MHYSHSMTKSPKIFIALSVSTALAVPFTYAQDLERDSGFELEEIIVTARKREESLLEVPLAITAFTEAELHQQNIVALEDLANFTPGLSFQDVNGAFQNPSIRGMAQTSQISPQGNVGVFLDGVFLSNRSALEFGALDLARIEVVKGPQSALYGRNTFAGAINYVTKAPELGAFNGQVRVELGTDEWRLYSGNVNIPIGKSAALQLFGGFGEFDGTIDNAAGANDVKLGGFQDRDSYGARFYIEPTEDFAITLFAMRGELLNDGPALVLTSFDQNNGGSPTIGTSSGPGFTLFDGEFPQIDEVANFASQGLEASTDLIYAKFEYDFDASALSLLVSDVQTETSVLVDIQSDLDAVNRQFFLPEFSFLSQQVLLDASTPVSDSRSLELRWQSTGDSALEWSVGTYYFESDDVNTLDIYLQPLRMPTAEPFLFVEGKEVTETEAISIFGSLGYQLTEKVFGQVELRYTDETIELLEQAQPEEIDSNFVVPRFTLEYAARESLLIYGSVGRGVKSGGFNNNDNVPVGSVDREFDEETNWSYELGAKGEFFDGVLQLTTAVWYTDWEDVQVQSNIPGTVQEIVAVTRNGGSITTKGFEVDANINVTENFSLRLGGAYIDPEYDDGFIDGEIAAACGDLPGSTVTNPGCSSDVGGNQVSRTSDFQFLASAKYTIPELFADYEGYARVDFSHEAGKYSTGLNLNNQGDVNMTNLRIGILNESYELSAYVDNVFDEKWTRRVTVVGTGNEGFPASGVMNYRIYPGQLRTVGVTFTANF